MIMMIMTMMAMAPTTWCKKIIQSLFTTEVEEEEGEEEMVVMETNRGITDMEITGGLIGITMMTGLREMNKNGKTG